MPHGVICLWGILKVAQGHRRRRQHVRRWYYTSAQQHTSARAVLQRFSSACPTYNVRRPVNSGDSRTSDIDWLLRFTSSQTRRSARLKCAQKLTASLVVHRVNIKLTQKRRCVNTLFTLLFVSRFKICFNVFNFLLENLHRKTVQRDRNDAFLLFN